MTAEYDAVIVGGGHNGLVAAAYLARSGLRTLVCERREVLGGAAVSEHPFGPEYTVTSLSYVVSLLPADLIRDLRLGRHGYHVYPQGPYFAPRADGRYLRLPEDPAQRHAEIARFSRQDADNYPDYEARLARIGSILGPLLGTILLTVLPEFAAPLVAWSTFLYAVLLLVIVLAIPGGIAELLDFKNRRPLESDRAIVPRPDRLVRLLGALPDSGRLKLEQVALSFGGVRAIDGLDLEIRPGQVHGLIGPNGSGKTTTLNVISGYYTQQSGTVRLNGVALPAFTRHRCAHMRIARTFQTPRIVGSASVLQNVMIGGTIDGKCTFVESLLSLPRHRRDEVVLRDTAMLALEAVGLERLAAVRADRLQHSELRFTEIARALMLRPAFLLLDEPAAGLSAEEIGRLGVLLLAIARAGTSVLLVEHHADLIFDICHHVTVLNLGKILAAGTPAEIQSHREVVNAYLGG